MKKVFKKVLGDPQAKTLKRVKKRVDTINKLEPTYQKLSDKDLAAKTQTLKQRLAKESLDAILPDAFALVRETARRLLGQRHFDVQLMGGIVLHEGSVAELKTGEGKTLVATAPVFLNALTERGVHVVTVNEYLVRRDAGWMGQIYHFLGLTTGVIIPDASFIFDPEYTDESHDDPRFRHLKPCTRQEAYAADITYGTNNEFGFDYLRDNMVREKAQLRQRPLHFAIVDEVDSILIDEARTPLIISAPSSASGSAYAQFARIAAQLKPEHYEKDEKRKSVHLTDKGVTKVEKLLGISNLYDPDNVRQIYHLNQALRAETLFTRDKDYVVTKDGEVVIVDEFTGRMLAGRRYNEGLHQAIEAKENVEIQEESMTLATISFQNYFRIYEKLSGMTGTAATESEEFHEIYKLDVVEVPTNKKQIRIDSPDRIYRTEKAKFRAIINTVQELHTAGQPVLIGSSSIEKNEELSRLLKKAHIPHEMLNAKNNEKEASIVARAGQSGAVTLATNIAGRGTDIVVDEAAKKSGGLFVLGSERHESRRIDNQLRGRTGRQGDPGKTQFYVSSEDDLMRVFGGDRLASLMEKMRVDEDTPIENKIVSRTLEKAQKRVEGFNYDTRKNVVKYDDVMNRHRTATYATRRRLLEDSDISGRINDFIVDESKRLSSLPGQDEEYEQTIKEVFPFDEKTLDRLFDANADKFESVLVTEAKELYAAREVVFTPEVMREVERDIYFQVLDNLWMQHLESMDHLREGIHWYGIGQKDPLVEYRKQAQIIYDQMLLTLRFEVVRNVFRAEPIFNDSQAPVETTLTRAAKDAVANADKVLSESKKKEVTKQKKTQSDSSNARRKKRKKERQHKKAGRKK